MNYPCCFFRLCWSSGGFATRCSGSVQPVGRDILYSGSDCSGCFGHTDLRSRSARWDIHFRSYHSSKHFARCQHNGRNTQSAQRGRSARKGSGCPGSDCSGCFGHTDLRSRSARWDIHFRSYHSSKHFARCQHNGRNTQSAQRGRSARKGSFHSGSDHSRSGCVQPVGCDIGHSLSFHSGPGHSGFDHSGCYHLGSGHSHSGCLQPVEHDILYSDSGHSGHSHSGCYDLVLGVLVLVVCNLLGVIFFILVRAILVVFDLILGTLITRQLFHPTLTINAGQSGGTYISAVHHSSKDQSRYQYNGRSIPSPQRGRHTDFGAGLSGWTCISAATAVPQLLGSLEVSGTIAIAH